MDIALIGLLTFLASIAGTLSSFGASTIMVAVLLMFYPLTQVLLLVAIIHWFDDLWKMILFRKGMRWLLIIGFAVPGVAASYAGARTTITIPEKAVFTFLGLVLIVYASYLIFHPLFRLPQNLLTAAAGGTLSGFMAGIMGMGGAARGAFLTIYDLPKEVYIATSGAIAILIDSARIATYHTEGVRLTVLSGKGLGIYIPLSFAGAAAAKYLAGRIPQKHYRTFIAAVLITVGVKFLLFGG
ncbi:MAG: sulfite exporter TauE/SafE family protein [Pseudomonadota bacterium]|jgi:uncharacterized membrane protein YfcA